MKKLTRNTDDRWIAGICSGLADYTGMDATVVRLVLVVLTVLGAGSLIIAYLVAWVLIPKRSDTIWVQPNDVPPTPPGPGQPSA
ncbi:PspC domain-containing protein [Aeromicrobium sp. SMF47]|uniref:PspC domain-containing protein n=1 Tax=Aeromicrobium yanjiei TaxID=2662028 RepID=A0A5Q2ML27_9ACTN|nr:MULTISPECIES: PspC domain-containing protein [Aeromicrobium]MRJ76321.1 PspC domain-containing protein [Aeromicrobium yanjiei]MRK00672.1 PspC domain-containing protein [Aeromicrobium sp. S22]QGG42499.1 PspC domain-containing protein [Aeromicrobium yanjiei]